MYFVWESDANLYDDFMYVSRTPDGLRTWEWITGARLPAKPPVLTLTGDSKYASALSDMVLTQFELPVLSPRAISTLEGIGVDNIEYFPVRIKRPKTKGVEDSYKIANVVGTIACLDRDRAIVKTLPDNPNEIMILRQYHILGEKVAAAGRDGKLPLVFRLGEFPSHVLVHESVKTAFEKQKLTGAKFTLPEKVG